MLEILGWILWIILGLATLSFWLGILTCLLRGRPFTYAILLQAVLFTLVLAVLLFVPTWSKLHILWIAPLIFFAAPIAVARLVMR